MKIKSIRIQNFGSFKDETIEFNNYTSLVGANGVGKSTIIKALNIFFQEQEGSSTNISNLGVEDFHNKDISLPIIITIKFHELSDEAKEDFKDYYRHDQLIISAKAEFNAAESKAEVKQYGSRLGIMDFAPFFKALSKDKVDSLREKYKTIQDSYSGLPDVKIKNEMVTALREYEISHSKKCVEIESEDNFYGFSKGVDKLEKYIQWVFVPAIKDITKEQLENKNTYLGKLLQRTIRNSIDFTPMIDDLRKTTNERYCDILNRNESNLEEISNELKKYLSIWSTPQANAKVCWDHELETSIKIEKPVAKVICGEGSFEGDLSRFGHGYQRSYLFALLQLLSEYENPSAPTLILACEEPELYQHPPQSRYLFDVLQALSKSNAQIIISTHSPYFINGEIFEDIRIVRKIDNESKIFYTKIEDFTNAYEKSTNKNFMRSTGFQVKIHQALQPVVNEIFFTNKAILVEGLEDFAYIVSYMNLLGIWDDYRKHGCHIIPVGGKSSLLQPLLILQNLKIPVFVVFDSDSHKINAKNKDNHIFDNLSLLRALGYNDKEPFPADTVWQKDFVMWKTEITEIIKEDFGENNWEQISQKATTQFGKIGDLKKNVLYISLFSELAWKAGVKSKNLIDLCNMIIGIK